MVIRRILTAGIATLTLVAGCRSDRIIIDDFGTVGYASLAGTVTRYPSEPFRQGALFIKCGGFAFESETDTAGEFQVELHASSLELPELERRNWHLPCLVRAGIPGFVSDTVDVPFATEPDSAVTTLVMLIELAP